MGLYATTEALADWVEDNPAAWLSDRELTTYVSLASPRRRASFLSGRVVAKRLIARWEAVDPAAIDIDTGLTRSRRERPQVTIAGQRWPYALSIAHTDHAAIAVVAAHPDARVGVDLVEPQDLGPGFLDLWFTPAERRWLADTDPMFAATVWGMKEAVYKAVGTGPFVPRAIEILPRPGGGFRSRPPCDLSMFRSVQGEIVVVAIGDARPQAVGCDQLAENNPAIPVRERTQLHTDPCAASSPRAPAHHFVASNGVPALASLS